MDKVTYLFGAGASALSLPTIKDIPERLINFKNALVKIETPGELSTDQTKDRDILIKEIDKILGEIVKVEQTESGAKYIPLQASIDTYAKKLFIVGEYEGLDRLKAVLCVFFSFEQTVKVTDPRYDNFFASILRDSAHSLPKSVNIISWNYDSQFEIAYSKFSRDERMQNNMSTLNVVTKLTRENRDPTDRFSIFKINGTAAFHDHIGKIYPILRQDSNILPAVHAAIWYSNWLTNKQLFPSLSFAWEGKEESIALIKLFESSAKDTVALVIIGYSIPFFNREIDKQIIDFSIDSRTARAGELFFALSQPDYERAGFNGTFADAHNFIAGALERGAIAAVARRERVHGHADKQSLVDRLLVVDDVIAALQTLARKVYEAWGKPVVGITGSAGKTTTKELTAHVLAETGFRVLKSERNYNNGLGLPLSVLQMVSQGHQPDDYDLAVLEMGMSSPTHEIRRLAQITPPDIGVELMVAPVHLEHLGTIENVAAMKAELL